MTGTWQSKPLPSLCHSFLIPLMLEPLQICSGSNDFSPHPSEAEL